METAVRKSIHPLIATAAISVTVFSAVGIAAISGLMPLSRGTQEVAAPMVAAKAAPTPSIEMSKTASLPATRTAAPVAAAPSVPAGPSVQVAGPSKTSEANRPVETKATSPAYEPRPTVADMPREIEPVAQAESTPAKPICQDCGTIEAIREVKQGAEGSGIGAVAGGVTGAVLGRQVGNGRGRTIATVVGAVGGAVAGHQIEKRVRTNTAYEVSVRMEDGSVRTVTETTQPTWRNGDKVRIENGRITTLS